MLYMTLIHVDARHTACAGLIQRRVLRENAIDRRHCYFIHVSFEPWVVTVCTLGGGAAAVVGGVACEGPDIESSLRAVLSRFESL